MKKATYAAQPYRTGRRAPRTEPAPCPGLGRATMGRRSWDRQLLQRADPRAPGPAEDRGERPRGDLVGRRGCLRVRHHRGMRRPRHGTRGMKYSLPSRDLIADSIEIVAQAHALDGLVLVVNCDKIVPGMLMAAARLDIPSVIVSGGPMLAGSFDGKAVGWTPSSRRSAGTARERCPTRTLPAWNARRLPGFGLVPAGLFTANTMNCLSEALGLALPGNGSIPAVHADRTALAARGRPRRRTRREGRHHPAADPHPGRLHECRCPGHGPGRIDELRAAPTRHRRLRRGYPVPRRFRPDEREGSPPLRPRPLGTVLHAAPACARGES